MLYLKETKCSARKTMHGQRRLEFMRLRSNDISMQAVRPALRSNRQLLPSGYDSRLFLQD